MSDFQNQDPFSNLGNPSQPSSQPENLPNAVAVLVLGILSILGLLCYGIVGLILAIIAVVLAIEPTRKYRENPGRYSHSSWTQVNAGKICSYITLGIFALMILVILMFGLAIIGMGR